MKVWVKKWLNFILRIMENFLSFFIQINTVMLILKLVQERNVYKQMIKPVALVEFEMPRILTVDFSLKSIDKLRIAGYSVKDAQTGSLESQKGFFSIPCSINDVDILLIHLRPETFHGLELRKKSKESIEESPCFNALTMEVWNKGGVVVLIVDGDVDPSDMEYLGINNTGVLNINRRYIPSSFLKVAIDEIGKEKAPLPTFPEYKGNQILLDERNSISSIYNRYATKADQRVFSVRKDIKINGAEIIQSCQNWVVTDDRSTDRGCLCLEIENFNGKSTKGRILLVPHFNDKTIEFIIDLLNEDIKKNEPYLFSKPNHDWLEKYLPYPVKITNQHREEYLEEAIKKVQMFEEESKNQHEHFFWMDILLTGKDEEFAASVSAALKFLGFDVIDMDKTIPDGERKREDFRIHYDQYFALVEVKSTERGANEKMIQDLQTHINRYMREFKTTDVPALLIVNHSIKLDPQYRHDFYKGSDIHDRLADNYITAIDSVFLHDLCQGVLSGVHSLEQGRMKLICEGPVLSLKKMLSTAT
ncbi:hypothetical protein GC096_02230 [Paenibacillus sp. LMG 31461]|uniref:Restriction endonuclease type IV Mrr domain-containing protein n=1 Tax=Paenibacillus plantarum TaxID=2654975 RepID=A0ABX1X387_9BACL|nr:hypothetical protein [Paenibacillus plantarum]NOU62865.1 hypothetical protein [Paenibacillus plantarum]